MEMVQSTTNRIAVRSAFALLVLLAVWSARAADFALKTAETPAPNELSESIRGALEPKTIQLTQDGKPLLEIWLRRDLPLKNAAAKLDSIGEATLVAAVAVRGPGLQDYKQNDIPEGVFTARFLLQPQDGDHLGTAEFNYFLALIAADADKDLNGLDKFRPVTKASGKLTPSGHPLIISLRPVSGDAARTPALTEPAAEHKAIRLSVSAKGPGGEKVELPFDFVYEGHGHIQ
jgi:hypothetical protein